MRLILLASLLAAPALAEDERPASPPAPLTFTDPTGKVMVQIPAGTFIMGNNSGPEADERGEHEVTLSQPYWLDQSPTAPGRSRTTRSETRPTRPRRSAPTLGPTRTRAASPPGRSQPSESTSSGRRLDASTTPMATETLCASALQWRRTRRSSPSLKKILQGRVSFWDFRPEMGRLLSPQMRVHADSKLARGSQGPGLWTSTTTAAH